LAVRIKVNGMEVETDSVAEALEMVQRLSGGIGNEKTKPQQHPLEEVESQAGQTELGPKAKGMLRFLMSQHNGASTVEVAGEVGVSGAKGLAALTRQIRNWANDRFGVDRDGCIIKDYRDIGGALTPHVRVGDPLKNSLKGHEKEYM